MFYEISNSCLRTIQRWRTCWTVLAAAACLTKVVHGQATSAIKTLGGTGDAGFVDGIHGISEFHTPTALALRGDGHLFISDYDNDAVRDLGVVDTKVLTIARVSHPSGLAFDSKTNLFVASESDGTIIKFDKYNQIRQTLRPGLTGGPITALAMDRNDNLYIAEQNGLILRLNTNGVVEQTLSAPLPGTHEFRGIAVTDDGILYVSDAAANVIWRFKNGIGDLFAGTLNQSGSSQGELGFGRFGRPEQIAVGPNSTILVADRGNHQVRVVSCDGIITILYGVDPALWYQDYFPGWKEGPADDAHLREPVGIAADSAGNVYDSEVYYNLIRTGSGLNFPLACNSSSGGTPSPTNTPPIAVLFPNAGFFPNGVTIIITASNLVSGFTRDTRLFYTINGTDPTKNDQEILIDSDGIARLNLAGPIDLAILRVRAFLGDTGGVVTSALPTQVPTPIFTPDSGYYPMGADIRITSTNGFPDGTLLYYTLDGSVPTTNSTALAHDGTQAVLSWRDAQLDLRSLKVKAFLGPNQGSVVAGRPVSFPGEPTLQGEVGIPPARHDYKAGIGSFYILPVVANLRDGQQLRSLQFNVEISALGDSPYLEKTDLQLLPMTTNDFIQVLPASVAPPDSGPFSFARNGTNEMLIAYLGTNSGFNVKSGYATVAMLGIQFRAQDSRGNFAQVGDQYKVRITQVSGTSGGIQSPLPLKAMDDIIITLGNIPYREGDTFPAYWYNAGDFGDGTLDNGDGFNAVYAAFGFRRPFPLCDAFAAMDVYRVGVLENVLEYSDSLTILLRAAQFESPDVFRVRNDDGEWQSSTTRPASSGSPLRALATALVAWHRDVTIAGGVVDKVGALQAVSVPVYMKAQPGVLVSGLQFVADVVPMDGAPVVTGVSFEPSPSLPASGWINNTVPIGGTSLGSVTLPNTVYARWDNLPTALQGTVLLGYIRFVTPSTVQAGQHYNVSFHDNGGAAIDPNTSAVTGYLFQSVHGEVWPWEAHPEVSLISDEWKSHFFGSIDSPLANQDLDADGDGFSNLDEFIAGSDPNARDWHVKTEGGHLLFRWVGVAGKTYTVETTGDFKNWNAVSGRISGQDAFLEYNEPASTSKARFYRLNIQ